MLSLVAARAMQTAVGLLFLTLIVFFMSRLSGSPLDLLLPFEATREERERLTEALGLDKPLYEQYARYVFSLSQGDLGRSYRSRLPVSTLLAERFPATLTLAFTSGVLSWLVGVPLGVFAAQLRSTRLAGILQGIAVLGQSAPVFWVGILLIQVFSVQLRWLPSGTNVGLSNLVLPSVTLALLGVAGISRLLRSSLLEVLDRPLITFARSKGLSETTVMWKHAVRNALLPAVSYGGLFFATLVGGAIVVEVVFAWPGVGLLGYEAVVNRDFPVIQGVVLYTGTIVILVNLLVDILYVYLDPRVRYGRR